MLATRGLWAEAHLGTVPFDGKCTFGDDRSTAGFCEDPPTGPLHLP